MQDLVYEIIASRYLLPTGDIREKSVLSVEKPSLIDQSLFSAFKSLILEGNNESQSENVPSSGDADPIYWSPRLTDISQDPNAEPLGFVNGAGTWVNVSYTFYPHTATLYRFSLGDRAKVSAYITPCHNKVNTDMTLEFRFGFVSADGTNTIPIPSTYIPHIRIAGVSSFLDGCNTTTATISGYVESALVENAFDQFESADLVIQARFARGSMTSAFFNVITPVYIAMATDNSVVRVELLS